MTNYNKRLDEVLEDFGVSCARQSVVTLEDANEAKQAIASLTKEMVAEALKELKEEVIGEVPSKMNTDNWKYDRRVAELKLWQHQAIDNKIKELGG